MADALQPMPSALSSSPRVLDFALALARAAEPLWRQRGLSSSEVAEGVAVFAAVVAGSNAQPGRADLVLSLMQMSMANAAAVLGSQGLWFDPDAGPS